MQYLLIVFLMQGVLGAFDTLYHHEFTERLPWRRTASKELLLHGVRNLIYALIFLSFAWLAWLGIWAWVFAALLAVEIFITLWDFVEEDRTRALPASERVTHSLLAINYGVILALFAPIWWQWRQRPDGFAAMDHSIVSWLMTFFAAGVLLWGVRDFTSGLRLGADSSATSQPAVAPALDKPAQRILVTGGTGFIGRPLCQMLIDQGHHVAILTRQIKKAAGLFTGRVELIESLDCLGGDDAFDAIINLAGETIAQRWTVKSRGKILNSRLEVTRALTEYIARIKHKPQVFIQASAIGIYGTSLTERFTEQSAASSDATGAFPREICEAVEAVAAQAGKHNVRICLLRTGLVLESDGGALAQMLFPFEFCLGGPMGHGRQWMSWIHREDVIRLICFLINRQAVNGAVNAVAPKPVTSAAFSKALGKALRRPAFLPFPALAVRLLFSEMGKTLLLSGQQVIPEKALANGFAFHYPTIDAALGRIFPAGKKV